MNLKYISVLCFLAGATAYGQVKTNQKITEEARSNAFLDASENTDGQAPNIGRGLLFPQTDLSTFKLDINAADGVNYPTYFDGMIVYNTKEGGKTSDTNIQVTDNLQKGFYYFSNPTGKTNGNITNGKWVRLSDSQANDQLWAQRDNNGITETYLKPSLGTNDILGFYEDKANKNKGFLRIAGVLSPPATSTAFYMRSSINFENYGADAFPLTHPYTNTAFYDFNHRRSVVTSGHVNNSTSTVMKYNGGYNALLVQDPNISKPLHYLNGQTFEVLIEGEDPDGTGPLLGATLGVNANTMVGLQSWTRANTSGNLGSLEGFRVVSRSIGSGATIGQFTGQNMGIRVSNNQSASVVRGINNQMALETGQASNMGGLVSYITSKASNISTGKGMDLRYIASGAGSTMTEYIGVFNSFTLEAGNSVDDFYGYRLHIPTIGANSTVKNAYGLHLDNVNFSNGNNYAIYTGLGKIRFGDNVGIGVDTPVEKLEVAGKVKATAFMGTNGATLFPDYVFQKYYTGTSSIKADYSFKTLSQVENFVKANGHLPGYQSAAEIKKQGYIDIMATQLTNVEKIEELYLHSIEQEKKIEAQQKQIEELKSLVQQLLNK
ncbi:hypothetical protein OKE80_01540 [Riemerella anatipestifer]|uniref:Peptidase S74 domain-containing protein n=1 Tax=Riemerella anatipestifer TaxID=34085 RepID=A0A1S7DTV4_RIEAN|nr:hypothetical protein [Riemerella anatipestifer]AQY22555.1 hypothetical protein AB406_1611 [Riemerella anatipestifer]MCO7318040.1 hypothetical protein [Riemerella anatipestifer]MCQ4154198.1 hypothetical protein [Riemerella anatipestifer]MCQ4180176.1 hypothetical protein [Riemerella anatipestifer]MCW0473513.1 hypothetical protein [Riemerella anatipestifer]